MDRNIGQVRYVADRKITIDNISEILGISVLSFLFTKQKQSLEWHTPSSPRKKKVRLDKYKGKVMLVLFFDYQGLVYYEFTRRMARATPGFYPSGVLSIHKKNVAIAPLVIHIIEFPVYGYRSGSGLTTPYFALQDSPCCFSRLPRREGLLGGIIFLNIVIEISLK
ncbi:hypothetical protein LAZ67_3001112 [Cordylochernes scorpioides]|uniref:Uncharacterized protein n=1 Tax=Cordylochernes scorpioides TaxID=51811 RepID=A0ABY6K6N1_9ARAC|nr:hypothetical protein LAZ67_3001112 [Cordylochernes scorpioides]